MLNHFRILSGIVCLCACFNSATAQTQVFIAEPVQEVYSDGSPTGVIITNPQPTLPVGAQPAQMQPGQPQPVQPPTGQQPAGASKPDENKKPVPEFIVRPEKPETAADPRELLAEPGTDGKLSLSFSGQTWPGLTSCDG
ncbi:MAG: hypothetical protein O2820_17725 [Planctomycetota bacterium]|nr:hypothetical protein [Planctomycetota bacterium]MDA1251059.1 hypothetical protein [Planctomycetota bacterium]